MGICGGLTATQRDLRDQVCAVATILDGRLRILGPHSWCGADTEVVRGWLFDVHHADVHDCQG